MAEHTALPWFKNSKFEVGPRPRTDDQHDGMLHAVADVFGDNREADAAFIVKAVNNHQPMLDLLQQLAFYFDLNDCDDRADDDAMEIPIIDLRKARDLYRAVVGPVGSSGK